jgi:MFS family permease
MAVAPPAQISGSSRPLYAMLAGSTISLIGNSLTAVALPWFVLQTTGSPAQAGLVGFAQSLPHLIAGLAGGILVDRLGYNRVAIASDLISGLTVACIPLLYYTVGLSFTILLILVFLGAILDVPGLTARRAMLPELAKAANVPLARANAWSESSQSLAWLLGPPVAGILIAAIGAAGVIVINAITFAISIVLIALCIPKATPAVRQATGKLRHEILAGLRFIRHDSVLLWMAIGLAISNCIGAPLTAVILPVFVKETSNRASDLGLLLSAGSIGILAGALLYGAIGHRVSRRMIWLVGFSMTPLVYWAMAASFPFWALLIVGAISYIALGPINPLMVTVRHERAPHELRGRVFASYSAIGMSAGPIGMLMGGYFIEQAGFRPTVLLLAIAGQLLATVMIFVPAFGRLEESVVVAASNDH